MLIDSASMHTTLKNEKYFSHIEKGEINVNTISDSANLTDGSGKANTFLHVETNSYTPWRNQARLL